MGVFSGSSVLRCLLLVTVCLHWHSLTPVSAGDCLTLWQIRMANMQTPSSFFTNWHSVSVNDTDCCSTTQRWRGVKSCSDLRVYSLTLDTSTLPAAQRLAFLPPSIGQLTLLNTFELIGTNVTLLPDVFDSLTGLAYTSKFSSAQPASFATCCANSDSLCCKYERHRCYHDMQYDFPSVSVRRLQRTAALG